MSDYHFKLAMIEGDFVWNKQPDTADFFHHPRRRDWLLHLRDGDVR